MKSLQKNKTRWKMDKKNTRHLSNLQIKKMAHQAVIDYEKSHGRIAVEYEKEGYDIRSSSSSGQRHIEVKGTSSAKPAFVVMQANEFKRLLKDDDFFLYLVRDIANRPIITEYQKDEVLSHFKGVQVQYIVGFSKSDFE